jgi:hypothetical protein
MQSALETTRDELMVKNRELEQEVVRLDSLVDHA